MTCVPAYVIIRKSTHLELNDEGDVTDSDAREASLLSGVWGDLDGREFFEVMEGGFHAEAPTILISDCMFRQITMRTNKS